MEEKSKLIAAAKEAADFFSSHLVPFYEDKVAAARAKGWKAMTGATYHWLENPLGIRVMLGGGIYDDRKWLHLSASYLDDKRFLKWHELSKVKDLFLGEETLAVQVFAPRSQWVNDRNNVLHLWSCLDNPVFLPDFRIEVPGSNGRLSI